MNDNQPKASVLHRIGNFFSLHDDEEFEEVEEVEQQPRPRRNVLAFSSSPRRGQNEVSIFGPRTFGDVTEIADAVRNRQVVIVNLLGADRSLLQRVVDFASGVAYTLDGRIQKLAEGMFLIVPPGVAVNSQGIRDSLAADGMFEFLQNRG
ncbi:MAG TPA: cell division protein SepF [Candidatus Acidoferrales bacterium]|nr:cell division protein SepF [Candidatus Acidoferrales bacterium]